jgi:hypothetical protein
MAHAGTQSGSSIVLIFIDGTIPMVYQSVKYNCPLQIWFTYDYPVACPTCVVVPVPSMRIREGHLHVGPNGLVYHPYLSDWTHSSSLEVLCDKLSEVFGNMPPVYSIPNPAPQPAPAAPQPTPQQPITPARVSGRDDDDDFMKALRASQEEADRRAIELQQKDDEAFKRAQEESKAADEQRKREAQRREEEERALRRAIQESQELEVRGRRALLETVTSKLQVTTTETARNIGRKSQHARIFACCLSPASPPTR